MIHLRNEKYDAIAGVSEIGGITLTFFILKFCDLLPFPFWICSKTTTKKHTNGFMNEMQRRQEWKCNMPVSFFSQEYSCQFKYEHSLVSRIEPFVIEWTKSE